MVRCLEHTLLDNPERITNGVIFDGFPRTIPQAEALAEMLDKNGMKLDAVIGLEVDEDELVRRMLQRGKETGRADDNLETIKNRLDVYHSRTAPLKEYYLNKGQYHAIDGNGTVDNIFADIRTAIESHN